MVLKLTPRPAPSNSGARELTVITWNCTGSDDPEKLGLIAELVWGPPNGAAFADLVVVQEFSKDLRRSKNDYDELCKAFTDNSWQPHKTDNEGASPTSKRSYFSVWNTRRLTPDKEPVLINDFNAPVAQPPPPPPRADGRPVREKKPRKAFDPAGLSEANNSPVALSFATNIYNDGVRIPLYAYTWHVSFEWAEARMQAIPDPADDAEGPITRAREIAAFSHRTRVAQEKGYAEGAAGIFVLAGDLNVPSTTLTQPIEDIDGEERILFPAGLGYRVVSGGGKNGNDWDHVAACHGTKWGITRFEPGRKLGDHKPLGARLTV